MKLPFAFKNAALADLRDISRYTGKTWGREQEAVYMKGLFNCFEKIAHHETVNTDYSHIKSGCFKFKISHHVIIFQWLEDGRPEIIRVLHESMDVPNQIAKVP
ncbi:MAG: type II toxin-antitoxin system RelE/ParE family toxin [Desulfuromonadaceae bacterium]